MGIDFSSVKVHIGEDAKRSADRLGAAAYAKNGEVYLGDCGVNPQVVAHELVHTAQQGVVKGGDTMSSPAGSVQMFNWRSFFAGDAANMRSVPH